MDLERIGSRHRDNSHTYVAESEALDQISKVVSTGKLKRKEKQKQRPPVKMGGNQLHVKLTPIAFEPSSI